MSNTSTYSNVGSSFAFSPHEYSHEHHLILNKLKPTQTRSNSNENSPLLNSSTETKPFLFSKLIRERVDSIGLFVKTRAQQVTKGISKLARSPSMPDFSQIAKNTFSPSNNEKTSDLLSSRKRTDSALAQSKNPSSAKFKLNLKLNERMGYFFRNSKNPSSIETNLQSLTVFDCLNKNTPEIAVAAEPAVKSSIFGNSTSISHENDKEDLSKRNHDIRDVFTGKTRINPEFLNKYRFGDLLGDGAFGFVITAFDSHKIPEVEVAVKFINKSKIHKSLWVPSTINGTKIPFEVSLLEKFNHPHIIKYVDHIMDEKYVLLITELHGSSWASDNPELNKIKNPGLKTKVSTQDTSHANLKPSKRTFKKRTSCDLFECIDNKISNHIGKKIFAQIALAVYYLGQNNIVHRDLKDENIVINSDYRVKIIDFGSASEIPKFEKNYFSKFNGTAHFASPEIVRGEPYQGPAAEIWSLGVLLYTITFGENPFQGKADILQGTFSFPHCIDPNLKDLIQKMLCYNPIQRITIEKVLRHSWLIAGVEQIIQENQAMGYPFDGEEYIPNSFFESWYSEN